MATCSWLTSKIQKQKDQYNQTMVNDLESCCIPVNNLRLSEALEQVSNLTNLINANLVEREALNNGIEKLEEEIQKNVEKVDYLRQQDEVLQKDLSELPQSIEEFQQLLKLCKEELAKQREDYESFRLQKSNSELHWQNIFEGYKQFLGLNLEYAGDITRMVLKNFSSDSKEQELFLEFNVQDVDGKLHLKNLYPSHPIGSLSSIFSKYEKNEVTFASMICMIRRLKKSNK